MSTFPSQNSSELVASALYKRTIAENELEPIAEQIATIQDYIKTKADELVKVNDSSRKYKQIYDDNTTGLEFVKNKKTEHESKIRVLTTTLELNQEKIGLLNKLNSELGTTSSGTDEIIKNLTTTLDNEKKSLSDLETFIPYKKNETNTSMETYISSQVRSLELNAELNKKYTECETLQNLYHRKTSIIELETKNQLKFMFKSRIEKLTTLFNIDLPFQEGCDMCDLVDEFIDELQNREVSNLY